MSEVVARLAVNYLRKYMFPVLPQDIRKVFPQISDPLGADTSGNPIGKNQVPNIVVGQYQDFGVGAATPIITVYCAGASEGMVNQYRHLDMHVDIWVGGNIAANVDGRRWVSIIYEYVYRTLQNTNWTGIPINGGHTVQIERSFETERSPVLFEPTAKMYHISNIYRVEALSIVWY